MHPPNASTDPLRRLALQLAIQLPENADEARQVLALTSEVMENFLLDGGSEAHRRARRLGWGLVDIEAAPPRSGAALPLSMLFGLCSLVVTVPVAWGLLALLGIGAGVTFMIGVTMVALVLGTAPALTLAVMCPLLHNLLLIPPALEFSRPTAGELVAAGAYVLLALLVPWIAARRTRIHDAVIRVPVSAGDARAPIRLVG